ncbi:MAG: HAMP domain-containing histidine kinase [Planctomycetia bacterium]|nr:HAMP domain-containing histidine kinase [Planctomycetia bacterium]
MTLAGRASAFFLAVLAVALLAFTSALYLVAGSYLNAQANERLQSTLVALTAALEIKPEGLEWEANERALNFGVGPDDIRWLMLDWRGRPVAQSSNLTKPEYAALMRVVGSDNTHAAGSAWAIDVPLDGQPWRLATQRMQAPPNAAISPPTKAQGSSDGGSSQLYSQLTLVSGMSLRPLHQTLNGLLVYSLSLSAAVWLSVAMFGRWLSRRALSPLATMSLAAREINAQDLGQRLPLSNTHDELQELGIAFNDLLSRVEDAFVRQHRFTAEASHQLRTPLTALLGQVEVALRQERSCGEYRLTLERVQRQGEHLTRIVEALLFLARADTEADFPRTSVVDLNDWVREHLTTRPDWPRAADLQIRWSSSSTLVQTEPILLGELFDILLDNAAKYSDPGSPITVSVARREGCAILEIGDAGIGIEPEEQVHLYDPFFRSSRARQLGISGIGLGLAIAKRIATALRGSIDAKSQVGSGTTFTLKFPGSTDPTQAVATTTDNLSHD